MIEKCGHTKTDLKKDYDFTKSLMKKAGELGFLSVSVSEEYGGMGMGFVSSMLVCDYISGSTGSYLLLLVHTLELEHFQYTLWNRGAKKKYLPGLSSGEMFWLLLFNRARGRF